MNIRKAVGDGVSCAVFQQEREIFVKSDWMETSPGIIEWKIPATWRRKWWSLAATRGDWNGDKLWHHIVPNTWTNLMGRIAQMRFNPTIDNALALFLSLSVSLSFSLSVFFPSPPVAAVWPDVALRIVGRVLFYPAAAMAFHRQSVSSRVFFFVLFCLFFCH